MKKIFFLFIITLSTFLSSCEEDNGLVDKFEQKNYLIGKWYIKQIGTMNNLNTIVYVNYTNDSTCEGDNYVLTENGTFEENSFEAVGTVCQNFQTNGTYTLDNNILNLTSVNEQGISETLPLSIISLTYNTINASFTDPDTGLLVFLKLEK